VKPYRSTRTLAHIIVGCVAANLAACVLDTLIVAWFHWSPPRLELLQTVVAFEEWIFVAVRLLVWTAMAMTFVWVSAAVRNLPALGSQPRFSPAMSVLWFFVPLANAVMPHQVMTALWRQSQPGSDEPPPTGLDSSVSPINWWWSLFVVGILLTIGLGKAVTDADAVVALVGNGMRFVIGLCFIAVVRGIQRRQDEQWLDLERRRAVPPPSADALR
jgi:Domain of unknown function (DUF4328)